MTRAVRAIAKRGCRRFVLTNAAGGIRPEWRPGLLMTIRDHLNLQGRTPLSRGEAGYARPYDEGLTAALHEVAKARKIALESGVYAGLLGPSYETPAEIRMLAKMGGGRGGDEHGGGGARGARLRSAGRRHFAHHEPGRGHQWRAPVARGGHRGRSRGRRALHLLEHAAAQLAR